VSLYVPEFAWTLDRIACVAPRESDLQAAFERIAFHLTTKLKPGQPVDLVQCRSAEGSVRGWQSFRLGLRSGLEARFCLLGTPVEAVSPSSDLLEQCEGVVWFLDPRDARSDALLRVPLSAAARARPQVFVGDWGGVDESDLRALALRQWARSFPQGLFLSDPEKLLADGFDWLLSF